MTYYNQEASFKRVSSNSTSYQAWKFYRLCNIIRELIYTIHVTLNIMHTIDIIA